MLVSKRLQEVSLLTKEWHSFGPCGLVQDPTLSVKPYHMKTVFAVVRSNHIGLQETIKRNVTEFASLDNLLTPDADVCKIVSLKCIRRVAIVKNLVFHSCYKLTSPLELLAG